MDKKYYEKRTEFQEALLDFHRKTLELFDDWKYRGLKANEQKEYLHWRKLYNEAFFLLMHVRECCHAVPNAPNGINDFYIFLTAELAAYFNELQAMKYTLDNKQEVWIN